MPAAITMLARVLSSDGVTVILTLSEANGYEIVSLEPLQRRHRRTILTDDNVESAVIVQDVLDLATYGLQVRVVGATSAQVRDRRNALLAAVERRLWRLEVTIDGVVETFLARGRADTSTRREWVDAHRARRHMQIRVPVDPRPLEE
jgi:hypothetical protein